MLGRLKAKTKKAKSANEGVNSKFHLLGGWLDWCTFQPTTQRNTAHLRATVSEEEKGEYNNVCTGGVEEVQYESII